MRTTNFFNKSLRRTILVGGLALVACSYAYTTQRSISQHFASIFTGFDAPSVCIDRQSFTNELEGRLSNVNPTGGLFVCGRINSGKTTTVRQAISRRKFIAYINWRNNPIRDSHDLNNALKQAFKIKDFKDYFNTIRFRPGWILGSLLRLFPHLDFRDTEMKDLMKTQEEVEKVLKFAASKRTNLDPTERPVVFIDEIGAIRELLVSEDTSGRQFIQWMIKLSKDLKLCDIVFASNDGLMLRYLTDVDPLYFSSMVIPDFTPEEVAVVREYFKAKAIPKHIQDQVGGHASHVIQLYGSDMKLGTIEKLFSSFYQGERMKLKKVIQSCSTRCKPLFKARKDNCIEVEEFHKIMKEFLPHLDSDPEIPWDTLQRKAAVPAESIYELIRQDVLFYNPGPNALKGRTKLFLHVYEQEYVRGKRIEGLLDDVRLLEMIVRDEESTDEEKREKLILIGFKQRELENLQA